MSVTAALLAYVLVVIVAGPRFLRRLAADGIAPRMAITAWLTAVVTVIGCSAAAVALLLIEAAGHWDNADTLLASCLERLQAILIGHSGRPAQMVAAAAVTLALGGLIAVAVRMVSAVNRMRAHTLDHADAVRLVGRPAGDGVVYVDALEPAAYCVAGRPAAIVVTSAAVAALDRSELAAVIAHERAHLRGRHAHVIAAVRGVASALPGIPFFTAASAEIGSLLEMCADDAAARRHGRKPLLDGLLTLSGAGTPARGLAAARVAVLVRARRLAYPPTGITQIRTRATLGGAVAALAGTPIMIAALALSGALICFA